MGRSRADVRHRCAVEAEPGTAIFESGGSVHGCGTPRGRERSAAGWNKICRGQYPARHCQGKADAATFTDLCVSRPAASIESALRPAAAQNAWGHRQDLTPSPPIRTPKSIPPPNAEKADGQ